MGHSTWTRSWSPWPENAKDSFAPLRRHGPLKAYIAIFELLGREDRIELKKAQRVVEKRRGDLLGLDTTPGGGNTNLRHAVDIVSGSV